MTSIQLLKTSGQCFSLSILMGLLMVSFMSCKPSHPTSNCHPFFPDSSLLYDPGRIWPVSLMDTDYCKIEDNVSIISNVILNHNDSIYLAFVKSQCNNHNGLHYLDSLLETFGEKRNELCLHILQRRRSLVSDNDDALIELLSDINKVTEAIYGLNSRESFVSCMILADWYKNQEEYEKADTLYQVCVERIPCTVRLDAELINHVYYYQGAVARQESEFDRALIFFDLSRNICKKLGQDSLLARILNEESIIYGSYFDFEKSLELSDSAIAISKQYLIESQLDKAYLIKGITLTLTRQFKEAQKLLLENFHKANSKEHKADLLIRIINNCLAQGFVDSAEYFMKLIDPGVKVPKLSRAYNAFVEAKVWHDKQDWQRALNKIEDAIEEIDPDMVNHSSRLKPPVSRPDALNEMLLFFLGYKAKIFGDEYLFERDVRLLTACLELYQYIDAYVQSNFKYSDSGDELHAIDLFHQLYFDAVALFIQIGNVRKDPLLDSLIHVYNLRMQFKSLSPGYDLLSMATDSDPKIRKWINDLNQLNVYLPSIWKKDVERNEYVLESYLEKERLLDSIENHSPLIFEMYFNRVVPTIDEICDWATNNGSVVLSIKVGSEGDVIAIVYGAGLTYKYFPRSLHLLDDIIKNSKCIALGEYDNRDRPKLVDSMSAFIHPNVGNLVLNVEKELEYVPFGMLMDLKQPIYYCQSLKRVPFIQLDSLGLSESSRILSLVQSDADGADLPYTYLEGKMIEKKFGRSAQVYYAQDATYANFIRNRDHYNVIHFALHGVYNASDPSKCGIQLADHLLSLVEIGQMDWTGKTILLNICDAGNGKLTLGLGAISIAKAFIGAKFVWSPIYEIDDKRAFEAVYEVFNNHYQMNFYKKNLN